MTIIEDYLGIQFGIDQLIILGIIYAAIRRKKSFFVDWLPFLVLWFTYDLMRGVVDDTRYIHVTQVYDWELKLFGWMFGGQIPNFWIQQYHTAFFDIFFAFFYTLHMPAPLIVSFLIYYKEKDRPMFKEFSGVFLLTSYLALITFYIFPVAPPWYVWNGGQGLRFTQPAPSSHVSQSAAGLIQVDKLLGHHFYSSFYETFNANPYAAFPSLHSAYSIITAYYAIRKYGKKAWWMIFYPMGVWCGAVYLNHHYIIDLVAGGVYVFVSLNIVKFVRKKMGKSRSITEVQAEPEDSNGRPAKDFKYPLPAELEPEKPTNGKEAIPQTPEQVYKDQSSDQS